MMFGIAGSVFSIFRSVKVLMIVIPVLAVVAGTVYNKIKVNQIQRQLIVSQVELAAAKEQLKVTLEREEKLTMIVARRTKRKDEWKEEALKQKNRLLKIQSTPEYTKWAESVYYGE